jgi:hypothetical protein
MVDTGAKACPVCSQNATVSNLAGRDGYRVECPRCKPFVAPGLLLRTVLKGQQSDAETKELLPYLSAYIRQANERGERVVLDENWRDFALAHQSTPILRRATKLLELIAARSAYGHSTTLDHINDLSLVDAKDLAEFAFLLKHLTELGYISRTGGAWMYGLKVKGWEQLQPTVGIPGKCFVAMSFHESLKDAYDNGIFLAVKDCKMDPVRMDLVEHNEKICDKMIAEIRTCQFLVSDVTLQRPNVYFEGGFAMGLGRPVIWRCREDDREKVQFDTRQYNHIFWKDPKELRIKLRDRIKATISMTAVH